MLETGMRGRGRGVGAAAAVAVAPANAPEQWPGQGGHWEQSPDQR